MICPTCNGREETIVLACGPDGCGFRVMPCGTCDGTGAVDDRYPTWKQQGRLCKEKRCMPIYHDLKEMADLLGFDVVTMSRMERGLSDPASLLLLLEA